MSVNLLPTPFPFIPQLLAKAIARQALSNSVTAVEAAVARQYTRMAYIIRVLEAPVDTRIQVRNIAIGNIAADPSEVTQGQQQLVCILTMFEMLSVNKKAEFISAYRAFATIGGHGLENIVLENTWQPGHIPAVIPP